MTLPDDEPYQSPYEDEPALDGDILLLRAVPPQWVDWADNADGTYHPVFSHQAFTAMSPGQVEAHNYPGRAMSVGLMPVLAENFEDTDKAIDAFLSSAGMTDRGVAGLKAFEVRSIDPPLGIRSDPTGSQLWHALVFPIDRPNINTKAQKQLRSIAEVLRTPSVY